MVQNELYDQTKALIEKLAESTDQAAKSDQMKAWLQTMATFWHYSAFNQLIISSHGATRVAGYGTWRKLGRWVRKGEGENRIGILAPIIIKKDVQDEETGKVKQVSVLIGFKTVYVWDITSTDGKPLPEAPNWKSPEKQAELQAKLEQFCQDNGITIKYVDTIIGEAQGASCNGTILLRNDAGTKTLIHEIAHELLHWVDLFKQSDREGQELEAEAVAWVVGSFFGLDSLGSPNYIALWHGTSDDIIKRMGTIQKTACRIIEYVNGGRP